MHRLGLGGVLTFDHTQAVRGMGKVQQAFLKMSQSSNRFIAASGRVGMAVSRMAMRIRTSLRGLGTAFSTIGGGLRNLSFAMLPVALGIGKATGKAADFEQQMSNVASIYRVNKDEIESLIDRAKQLGVESVFTAKQAGDAMEQMARAGASQEDVLAGIGGVLNMAAAEGMELGEASKIVANTVKALGHEWGEASHIADVFALVSTKTNTTISELGNSFRMGAAAASQLGLKVDQAGAAMSAIADSGLQGTLAGTTFTAMMTKLAKPSGKAAKMMKAWRIEMHDSNGELRNIGELVEDFRAHIDALPTRMQRLNAAQELFGKRGARAYNALTKAGVEGYNKLLDAAKKASEGEGVAADMAKRRLDNYRGAMILLSASLEQASIEIFGEMLGPMTKTIREGTSGLNDVLFAVQDLKKARKEGIKIDEKANQIMGKYGETTVAVAMGFMDAIESMKAAWRGLVQAVKDAGAWIAEKFGAEGVRNLTAMAIKVASLAAAFVPVMLVVGLLGWAIKGGLFPIIKGLGMLFKLALGPVGWIILGIIALITAMKRENESLWDTIKRVWEGFKEIVNNVWENALKPFIEGFWKGFKNAIEVIGEIFMGLWNIIDAIFGWIWSGSDDTAEGTESIWSEWGETLGLILGGVLSAISEVIKLIGEALLMLRNAIWDALAFFDIVDERKEKTVATFQLVRWPDELRSVMETPEMQNLVYAGGALREGITGGQKKQIAMALAPHEQALREWVDTLEAGGVKERQWKEILRTISSMKREKEAAKRTGKTAGVTTGVRIDDKRTTNIKSTLCVDGREVGTAMQRHQAEINERAAAKTTPWVPRTACEYGAVPTSHESLA